MKQLLSLVLLFAIVLGIGGCRASTYDAELSAPSGENPSTEPTEPSVEPTTEALPQGIQIIAPLDIYEGDTEAAGDVNLTVQEGYTLIQSVETDDYRYNRYYNINSGAYGVMAIVPIVLEPIIQNCTLTYTAKTNFSGFYSRSPLTYKGKTDESKSGFNWRGSDVGPEEVKAEVRPEHIWVDIIIRANGNIVGFAVLEIVDWPGMGENCYMLADGYTECYRLIDSRFQTIDEEFVWQRIEQYHKYAE